MKHLSILALSLVLCSNLLAQEVLQPHFTEQSQKIVVPEGAQIFPEIHEGLIALTVYPQLMYIKASSGEYVWEKDFVFTRGNDWNSAYFSGGAMTGWRQKPGSYSASPFIVYPDGKHRDFADDISNVSSFNEGYALIHKGMSAIMGVKQTFIDKNGKEVFPALTSTHRGSIGDMTVYPVRENRRVFYNAELRKYGYADEKGNIVVKPQFDKALNFSEGLAAVMIKENYTEQWGFIDLTGKMVIPATYRLRPGRFSEGLAAVRIGNSESDYEMTYIDKTGKSVMDNTSWNLNEFHNGYAWVGTGCEKLFVMNKEFQEVSDLTAAFYYGGNGFGTCRFEMFSGPPQDRLWGFDFPNGMQSLNQSGLGEGDIFAPSGALLFQAVDARGNRVALHKMTEGELMFCQIRMENESHLKEKDVYLSCFINAKGEIVFYFEEEE
ncbi:MAG: WG repeat-containing protein [Bacteroidales bacterium]|nr:WG repeat-containing protein [Bacteroidales bacterium]